MSEPTNTTTAGSGQLRTLAVRITEDLRAQLDIIAQLTSRSTTEGIRLALEYWIEKTSKSDPAIQKKAEMIRAEIERDAQTRRNAIAAIFGGDGTSREEREVRPLPVRLQYTPREAYWGVGLAALGAGAATRREPTWTRDHHGRRSRGSRLLHILDQKLLPGCPLTLLLYPLIGQGTPAAIELVDGVPYSKGGKIDREILPPVSNSL